MSTNPVQPLPGQQVIHVAKDPDTDLEALFNAVLNPRPSSWRKKHLPESFFKEPDSGSHSRQSSTDSGSQQPPRLPPQHVRSHSSPASLQLRPGALAAASAAVTASPVQHAHSRHQSFDVTDELPLPPGWEMAYTSTGQKYFLKWVSVLLWFVMWHRRVRPVAACAASLGFMRNDRPPVSEAQWFTLSKRQAREKRYN